MISIGGSLFICFGSLSVDGQYVFAGTEGGGVLHRQAVRGDGRGYGQAQVDCAAGQ